MSPWLVLVACAVAAAGEAALTEDGAVALALRADPALPALAHGVDERLALRDAAGHLANPELRVQDLRSDRLFHRGAGDDRLEDTRVGLRWAPPGLGERGAREARADAEAASAAAELALARRAVVARVRALHATALGLDAQLAVAREALEERERLGAATARRAAQGAATVVEERAAEVERLEARSDVEALAARRGRALEELRATLGLPGEALVLSAEGAARCAPPEAAEQAAAITTRGGDDPLRRALDAELRAVDAQRSRASLSLLPWPGWVQLSYVLREGGTPAYWTLAFGATLPLLDRGGAERRSLAAARARIEDARRARAAAVDRELRSTLAAQAEQEALARRRRASAAAWEDALARLAGNAGTASTLQAGEVRARHLAARRAALEAELQCTLAGIEVDRLAGTRPGTRP